MHGMAFTLSVLAILKCVITFTVEHVEKMEVSVRELLLFLILVSVCTEEFEECCVGLSLSRGWSALALQVGRCAVLDEENRVCSVCDLVHVKK